MPTEGASAWRSRSAPARPLPPPRTGAPARPPGSLPLRARRSSAPLKTRCPLGRKIDLGNERENSPLPSSLNMPVSHYETYSRHLSRF